MLHSSRSGGAREMVRTCAARFFTITLHRSDVEDDSAFRPTSPESRHD